MEVRVNQSEIIYYNQPLYGYCHTDLYGKKAFFIDDSLHQYYIYDTDFVNFDDPRHLRELPILCVFYEDEIRFYV